MRRVASVYHPASFPNQLQAHSLSNEYYFTDADVARSFMHFDREVSGPRCLVIDGQVLSRHVIFSFSWQAWDRLDAVHTYAILSTAT